MGGDGFIDDEWDGWEEQEPGPEGAAPRKSRRAKMLALCAGLVVLAVLAGIGFTHLANSVSGGSGGSQEAASTGGLVTPGVQDTAAVQAAAQKFLGDWQSGDDAAAAALTDSPVPAKAGLDAYRADLHLSSLALGVTGTDTSGSVSFTVQATVHLPAGAGGAGSSAAAGVWSYTSQLAVYGDDGKWLVQWRPDLLAANLTPDTHLALLPVQAGGGQTVVTDAQKDNLADSPESALQRIAATLSGAAGSGGAAVAGTPGIDVEVVDGSGRPAEGIAPAVVTQPGGQDVRTTIDAHVEQAALSAVQLNQGSSMVVLQPTTGDILAIANNDDGLDNALMAQIAPGSTMKVVTSAALLDNGLTEDSGVACPATLDVQDAVTHNSDGESRPAGTPLIDDFASSCNNAFAAQYGLLSGDLLAHTAQRYFGLNEAWDIGLGQPTTYFQIPTGQPDKEVAAEAFGQGTLEASPLAMASVAATVDTGVFHQPVLLPGARQVSATPLPSGTDTQLKQMMRAVISYSDGTAHGIGFGSGVYAKTGTADDQQGDPPNSWIIVYDPSLNLAIGCVVLNAGAGDQYAGPEALSVLRALS